mmetsp:Transcript_45306/g.94902  ORF Transcript_45306/g.94902 Transcript_45306/m.94902 type:complete len:215 (-) Transcript_45306:1946-2590(-)
MVNATVNGCSRTSATDSASWSSRMATVSLIERCPCWKKKTFSSNSCVLKRHLSTCSKASLRSIWVELNSSWRAFKLPSSSWICCCRIACLLPLRFCSSSPDALAICSRSSASVINWSIWTCWCVASICKIAALHLLTAMLSPSFRAPTCMLKRCCMARLDLSSCLKSSSILANRSAKRAKSSLLIACNASECKDKRSSKIPCLNFTVSISILGK